MGRIVYKDFKAISVPADATVDVWSVLASATQRIRMHGWALSSSAVAAANIDLDFHSITAHGTGGSTPTDGWLADEDWAAYTATLGQLHTTPGTDGGGAMPYQWEQLGGVGHIWTPEMRLTSKVSEGFALTWNTATAATVSGWYCWEEL
tara:strand:+ start:169 stop:615 length:447 start_codon:yes stop_codon:yes gene_type:complete